MSAPVIAHIVPSLAARHGGPSRSTRALANAQAEAGATVDALAIEQMAGPPAPGHDVARLRIFPASHPRWLGCSSVLKECLADSPYEVLHHHGLWQRTLGYVHRTAAQRKIPFVISPRGMLTPWALEQHRGRKWLVNHLVHPGAFAHAAGWHATSPAEADDVRRQGFTQPICVAPNGVDIPPESSLTAARDYWRHECPAANERRVALFYSRFHRKKRLREMLDLWLSADRRDWLLLIVGIPEEYSLAEVQGWISAAGVADRVAVFDGANRPPPYAVASLFLFPSHSENFGLVVAEAMAAGVPVVSSDSAPWSALRDQDAGWCVPWENFGPTLANTLAESPEALRSMGARGRALAQAEYSWPRAAGTLLEFYRQLGRA